jgi:ATPase subunit of ABC transporter with duplicated ATPase domains
MTEVKTILLIGRTGRGKSTLANVITGAENKFKESGGSASETRDIQFEYFAEKEILLTLGTIGTGIITYSKK